VWRAKTSAGLRTPRPPRFKRPALVRGGAHRQPPTHNKVRPAIHRLAVPELDFNPLSTGGEARRIPEASRRTVAAGWPGRMTAVSRRRLVGHVRKAFVDAGDLRVGRRGPFRGLAVDNGCPSVSFMGMLKRDHEARPAKRRPPCKSETHQWSGGPR